MLPWVGLDFCRDCVLTRYDKRSEQTTNINLTDELSLPTTLKNETYRESTRCPITMRTTAFAHPGRTSCHILLVLS